MGVFTDKNGKSFSMVTSEDSDLSVLEPGYIITRDGQFIPVSYTEDHADVFTQYINKYNCDNKYYSTSEGLKFLVGHGNVVYLGCRLKNNNDIRGEFVLVIPDEEIGVSEEQIEALRKFKATNVSAWSNSPKVYLKWTYYDDSTATKVEEEVNRRSSISK
ncbi:MAG: hypothetical protein IKF82_04185 [Bacilli bacterium]|nr:hypothetical protein [Bacilli bacterium]MBR3209448.1 hypothetical protein [Bacilli bacterium]